MTEPGPQAVDAGKKIWVTLTGLPLTIKLNWPFHQSTSGADFSVLHGDIRLEGSDGLHAPVAVNLSQTVREIMPSLEPQDAEAQYLQTTPNHLLEIACRLVAAQGLLRIDGEWAEPTTGLMNQTERFEAARRQALEDLEKKHAFERG